MKEVFFNDRTISGGSCVQDMPSAVRDYAMVVKRAVEHGYRKVRYDRGLDEILLTETESLKSYCSKNSRNALCLLLLTTARHPYIQEDDEERLEKYIMGTFELQVGGKPYDDLCFCSAFLSDSFLVGMECGDEWNQLAYSIRVSGCGKVGDYQMFCVVREVQYDDETFSRWLECHDVEDGSNIVMTDVEPSEKPVKLRDDHGKDILKAHAGKLVKSPYVMGIVNSTQFKPNAKRYIDKVNNNGQIEIVLRKTDQGIGMVVQTTGRNLRETIWIASVIEEKYSE